MILDSKDDKEGNSSSVLRGGFELSKPPSVSLVYAFLLRVLRGIDGFSKSKSALDFLAISLRSSSKDSGTGYIFVQENGEPLYPTTPYLIFRKFIKELGFKPEPFHALRHSHVTELLRAGKPPHVVAKRIGDEVATVMKVYAHSNAEDDQDLANTYEEVLENA